MCKQDIRIARAAVAGDASAQAQGATELSYLKQNANRYSVAAFIRVNAPAAGGVNVMVYTRAGGVIYPLLGLSADHPAGVVSLVDVGQSIVGEIFAISYGSVAPDMLFISENRFDTDLEKIP